MRELVNSLLIWYQSQTKLQVRILVEVKSILPDIIVHERVQVVDSHLVPQVFQKRTVFLPGRSGFVWLSCSNALGFIEEEGGGGGGRKAGGGGNPMES